MTDREKREMQEDRLYEIFLAQSMAKLGKEKQYHTYLEVMSEKGKNGMTAEEIDAVKKRAESAASKF